MQRFELMTDQIEQLPTPLAVLNKVRPARASGRRDPHAEVSLPWYAPGQLEAGGSSGSRSATSGMAGRRIVGTVVDPKSEVGGHVPRRPLTRAAAAADGPGRSPVALSEARPVSVWRSGASAPRIRRTSLDGLGNGSAVASSQRSRAPSGTRSAGASRTPRCAARRARSRPRASARRRGPPTPRGSRSPRRPAATGSNRSRRARASSIRPASNWARARSAIQSLVDAGSTVSPIQATGPSYPSGSGTPASPCSSAISSARTTRRGLRRSICAARVGASRARAGRRAGRGRRRELRLEPCADPGSLGSASASSPRATARR